MKKINPTKTLKSLNQSPIDRTFLANYRTELESFVAARPIEQPGFFTLFTKTATVLGVFALAVLSSGGLVYASQNSLPGQLLYPVKLTTEKAQLAITANPDKKKDLKLKFIDKRIKEAEIISNEKNINKNAAKALIIIDQQIKEIEKEEIKEEDIKESEADREEIKPTEIKTTEPKATTEGAKPEPTREAKPAEPATPSPTQSLTGTASSSTTAPETKLKDGKADEDKKSPPQIRKNKRNDFERSRERLKESQKILEKLLDDNRQQNGRNDDEGKDKSGSDKNGKNNDQKSEKNQRDIENQKIESLTTPSLKLRETNNQEKSRQQPRDDNDTTQKRQSDEQSEKD